MFQAPGAREQQKINLAVSAVSDPANSHDEGADNGGRAATVTPQIVCLGGTHDNLADLQQRFGHAR